MAVSQNNYPANNRALVSSRTIPGTARKVTVRNGPAGDLLLWVAGQFDKRVENIDGGQFDDWGYAERPIRGATQLSNHASGTAVDLNATRHPLGTSPRANYSAAQINTIHAILREAKGCVRWGGDYTGRKDPMHFEIVASETACAAALAAVSGQTSGGGAASPGSTGGLSMADAKQIYDVTVQNQVEGRETQRRVTVNGQKLDALTAKVADLEAKLDALPAATALKTWQFENAAAGDDRDMHQYVKDGTK